MAVEDKKSQRGNGWGTPYGHLNSARVSWHGLERLSQRIEARRAPLGPAPTAGSAGA
jgi:hypothetical protein